MRALPINIGKPLQAECRSCLTILPIENFPTRNDRSGRYRAFCNTCANDGQRARYASHKQQSPFKLKTSRAKSRAQYLKVPFDLTPEYLESIWTGICPVYGVEIFLSERSRLDEFAAELDRFVPSLGYVQGNVTFLSRRSNRLKNNTTTTELKQLLTWMQNYENLSGIY